MRRKRNGINVFKLGIIGMGLTFMISLVQSIQHYFTAHPTFLYFLQCMLSSVVFIFLTYLIFYFPAKDEPYFKKVRNITFLINLGLGLATFLDSLLPEAIARLSFLMFIAAPIYVIVSTIRYFKLSKQCTNSPSYSFGDSDTNIMDMSWQEFEQFIAELMRYEFPAPEYEVELTQASHDGGIDVFVRNNDPLHSRTIVVQAKKYTNLIKTESVHALLGVMHKEKASEAIFITTSHFGPSSYTFADSEKRIKLIDGKELLNRLNRYGISNYYIDYSTNAGSSLKQVHIVNE